MKTDKIDLADNIFGMIKNLNADVKLDLISKISNSLRGAKKEEKNDSWKELFGAWHSDDSAEEIIEEIRASRHAKRQIENI